MYLMTFLYVSTDSRRALTYDQVTYGANPAAMWSTATRVEHLRWLAGHPTAIDVLQRLQGWFVDGSTAHEWRVQLRGDLSMIAPSELDRLLTKYLGSITGGEGGRLRRDGGGGGAAAEDGACKSLLLALEGCALFERGIAGISTALPRHFVVVGGEEGTARVHLTFPLAPLILSGMEAAVDQFVYRVVLACAQEALAQELRERLMGTYAVEIAAHRLASQSCLPGATSISFTCGGGRAPQQMLRGAARVLHRLQADGPSQQELLTAVRICCEQLRKEKSTLLGAVKHALLGARGLPHDQERQLGGFVMRVMGDAKVRTGVFEAVFPLESRGCVVLLAQPASGAQTTGSAAWLTQGWEASGIGDYVAERVDADGAPSEATAPSSGRAGGSCRCCARAMQPFEDVCAVCG